jgi:hypothetical protein
VCPRDFQTQPVALQGVISNHCLVTSISVEMTSRAVRGLDLIVYLAGHDKIPEAVEIKERCTEADLRSKFGGDDAIVFLKNKNLQKLPTHCRGAIVWLSVLKVICVVVKANGEKAHVQLLYPNSRKDQKLTICTKRLEGAYLQQIHGPPVMRFDQEFRPKDICPDTGHVVTPVGKNGCVKMSFHGPDIVVPESLDIPEEDEAALAEDPFGKLDRSKLPPNPGKGQPVPTVYIYSPLGRKQYQSIEKYLHDADFTAAFTSEKLKNAFYNQNLPHNRIEPKPVYCVPLGGPINANSSRYVRMFCLA